MTRVVRHVYDHSGCCNATSETVTIDVPVNESSATYLPPVAPRCLRVLGAELWLVGVNLTATVEIGVLRPQLDL